MMLGMGVATLSGGSVVVSHTKITAKCRVLVARQTSVGTSGELMEPTINPRVGFTLRSLNILDNSVVNWMVLA